jgi:hypothetical protein
MDTISLKRSLLLPLLSLYGSGAILGAGIHVLTGAVTTKTGAYRPSAFLLAALVSTSNGTLAQIIMTSSTPWHGGGD